MAPGPRTLTKDEFRQLLQRAAERQTLDEPRVFTQHELVEAGGDLGVDAHDYSHPERAWVKDEIERWLGR